MLLCGSWYTGTFATDSEEFYQKIGWFPFPAIEGSDADPSIMIGTVGDQFIVFNCEAKNWKLLLSVQKIICLMKLLISA